MEILADLKKRLETIGSNDVKTTSTRIAQAKSKALEAKKNAEDARNRALDLLKESEKIEIPNLSFDNDDSVRRVKSINDEADKLNHKLEYLMNQFNTKKDSFQNV